MVEYKGRNKGGIGSGRADAVSSHTRRKVEMKRQGIFRGKKKLMVTTY